MELGVVYLVVSGQMLIKTNSKKNLKHKLHFKTIFAGFFFKTYRPGLGTGLHMAARYTH
jgi:hypothetical protein